MVVMVSTEWCAPCQIMKKTMIPQVRQAGPVAKVAFAMVNPDRDRELAEKLIGGGPIPQLVMYRKTADGWTRQVLVGGQTVEAVEQFIKDGVATNERGRGRRERKWPRKDRRSPSEAAESRKPFTAPLAMTLARSEVRLHAEVRRRSSLARRTAKG